MFSKNLLAALVAAPAAVSAVGNAIVQNKCSEPAYFWSVDIDDQGSMKTIAPGASYSEPYKSHSSGGVSIKLSPNTIQSAYDSDNIAQFEYTLDGMIWYDISLINGNPFKDGGMTLIPGESSCPTKYCAPELDTCSDAYMVWNDDHATGACASGSDTTFVLCSGNPADGPVSAPKAPVAAAKIDAPVEAKVEVPSPKAASSSAAPAPKVTAAPVVAPAPAPAPDAGVFTTFVTQVVTVAARDAAPEPTGLPLKRDDSHANMHKRAAHRHHAHRHGAPN